MAPRSNKAKKIFLDAMGKDNPVFVQVLGICSTLAVTNSVKNTFVMCVGLLFTKRHHRCDTRVVIVILSDKRNRLFHIMMRHQGRFDLFQFNSVAAYFDLLVFASDENQRTVGIGCDNVAGSKKYLLVIIGIGAGEKHLGV